MTFAIVVTVVNGVLALWTTWQASSASTHRMLADVAASGAQRYFEWAKQEADRATGRVR